MKSFAGCVLALSVALALPGCAPPPAQKEAQVSHPVLYFEVPVIDMDRAISFYEDILGVDLERQIVDGYDMALFPFAEGAAGATGALAKGDVYRPSKDGAIVYFQVKDIRATVAKAQKLGRPVLYSVKDVGAGGLVAEIEDSEGNRLALNQPK
jgi:uncharacterized protein